MATKNGGGGWPGRLGNNGILTFYATGSTKNATFKNSILDNFFSIRICKVSWTSLLV